MRWQIGSLVLTLTAAEGVRARAEGAPPPPPPPPPSDGLTTVWTVEYVDVNGVQQKTTVNPDGSTVITIRQYAEVTFDARATRSESAGCDTAEGAAQLIGYGVNYGEAIGGTWGTSGRSRDYDIGPPIFPRCYEQPGARTPLLCARDPDGRESSITLTINVQALGAVTDISAGGSWPAWVNGGVYGLSSGNYLSRGDIEMAGVFGVRIIKLGGGSDPVVAEFRPETRGRATGYNITDRSRDVVMVGIDYARFATGTVGATYCGSYGGHCRYFGDGYIEPLGYYFDQAIHTNNTLSAGNCRHQRGTFIVNGGEVGAAGGEYCLIGGGRSWNLAGTSFVRTSGGSGGNPMRTYMDSTVLRHIQVYSTTTCFHGIKGSLRPNVYAATPTDEWPDDDTYGSFDQSRASWLVHGDGWEGNWGTGDSYFWVCDSLIGGPGMHVPTFICGWGPQNNDAPTYGTDGPWANEDCYECAAIGGYERNALTYNTANGLPLGGRYLSARGNTQLDGSPWSVATAYNNSRIHPTFRGPYIETDRPVPSAFA